ncbi:hypothetical protein [Bacillus sp. JCM 19041]|uniref:hypothetical protein n=1 Tax=Bacillus sp. JCM 19041 TaxID=1460637 RepID=UPI0006D04FDA
MTSPIVIYFISKDSKDIKTSAYELITYRELDLNTLQLKENASMTEEEFIRYGIESSLHGVKHTRKSYEM